MTCALIEFLIQSKGRIVNISSVSGFRTGKFWGPYSISKHALEAYSDTLRVELAQFGVKVIAVEPGNFRSNMAINWVKGRSAFKEGRIPEPIEISRGIRQSYLRTVFP